MTPDRLAEIKAMLERVDPAYKNHDVVIDFRDLITALEAAQERIATLEAEVVEIDAFRKKQILALQQGLK